MLLPPRSRWSTSRPRDRRSGSHAQSGRRHPARRHRRRGSPDQSGTSRPPFRPARQRAQALRSPHDRAGPGPAVRSSAVVVAAFSAVSRSAGTYKTEAAPSVALPLHTAGGLTCAGRALPSLVGVARRPGAQAALQSSRGRHKVPTLNVHLQKLSQHKIPIGKGLTGRSCPTPRQSSEFCGTCPKPSVISPPFGFPGGAGGRLKPSSCSSLRTHRAQRKLLRATSGRSSRSAGAELLRSCSFAAYPAKASTRRPRLRLRRGSTASHSLQEWRRQSVRESAAQHGAIG